MKNKLNKGYHKLIVWQRAKELVLLIYQYTESFPRSEEFGLKSQLRRAAVSVVLNIVEGNRRNSRKEFLNFLNIAAGSNAEVEAGCELSLELGFISPDSYQIIDQKISEVGFLLGAFIKSLKSGVVLPSTLPTRQTR